MVYVRFQKRGKKGRVHNRISAIFKQAGWTVWNVKVAVRDPEVFNRHLADIQTIYKLVHIKRTRHRRLDSILVEFLTSLILVHTRAIWGSLQRGNLGKGLDQSCAPCCSLLALTQ